MNFADVKSLAIPEGDVAVIVLDGKMVWQKNLFDGELIQGYINADTGVLYTSSAYLRCAVSKNFIPVFGGAKITVSNDMNYYCYVHEYDANYTFIQTQKAERSKITATLHPNTRYIKIRSDYTLTQNDLSVKYTVVLKVDIPGLPKYKTELAYLETTGTQWIDTGIILDPETFEYETKLEISKNVGAAQTFSNSFSSWSSKNQMASVGVSTYNTGRITLSFYGGTSANSGTVVGWDYGTIIEMSLHGSELTYNGTTYSVERPKNGGTKPNGTQPIFALRTGTSSISERVTGKCWYYRIWADSNTLVRDFIPVLDWDDVPCMYDKVSGELFYNQGTGEFEYDRFATEYHAVEYIESNGKQYIDSGIVASDSIITEVKCQSFVGNKAIVASGNSSGIRYQIYASSDGTYYVAFADKGSSMGKVPFTEVATIKLDPVAKKATINGTEFDIPYTTSVEAVSLWLFARNQKSNSANYRSTTKMWYCKMWDGDTLVRDFVPCYRKSDGKPGMYDLVTRSFFTNAGTGEFSYE